MPASTRTPQSWPPGAPAYYQPRCATWRITRPHRPAHQLLHALARRARRLHLPRLADYKLEPMPRTRWYS